MTNDRLDALAREYATQLCMNNPSMKFDKASAASGFRSGYAAAPEQITIGKYNISKFSAGGYWISCDGGEGMQTTEAFEKCIDEFYRREF